MPQGERQYEKGFPPNKEGGKDPTGKTDWELQTKGMVRASLTLQTGKRRGGVGPVESVIRNVSANVTASIKKKNQTPNTKKALQGKKKIHGKRKKGKKTGGPAALEGGAGREGQHGKKEAQHKLGGSSALGRE